LYVYALTNAPLKRWRDGDTDVRCKRFGSVFVIYADRTAIPEVSEVELRRQHSIVGRIADSAGAVLPARFGSLIDERELANVVRQRETILLNALRSVDGAVQMTVRFDLPKSPRRELRAYTGSSGRGYLEHRAAESAAVPHLPVAFRRSLERVAELVKQERGAPDGSAIYHLIARPDAPRYLSLLKPAKGLRATGPWPPFAFVPELW
jgi:hypothetical protein